MINHETGEVIGEDESSMEFLAGGPKPITQYQRSENLDALFAALSKAQGLFTGALKAGENPHFRSRYATLETVMDATREGRTANELAVIQMPINLLNGNIGVVTLLGHSSGQWIESTIAVPPAKFDAQGTGSVITYLRRYALMSILGIAPEDDDGEAAVARPANGGSAAAGGLGLRAGQLACPQCGKMALVLNRQTKQWVCWRKYGGCESSFEMNDPKLTGKPAAADSAQNQEPPEDSFEQEQTAQSQKATEAELKPLLDLIGEATDPEMTKRAILASANVSKLADMTALNVQFQVEKLLKKKAQRDAGNKRPRR